MRRGMAREGAQTPRLRSVALPRAAHVAPFPSVIDQILAHLRTRVVTAAHGDARSPPSTRGPSGAGATRRPAAAHRARCVAHRCPAHGAGTFGVRVRPTGAFDRSPLRPGADGKRRSDGHRGAAAGGAQVAAGASALAWWAIAPNVRRIFDRLRLNFLSRGPLGRSCCGNERDHRERTRGAHRCRYRLLG